MKKFILMLLCLIQTICAQASAADVYVAVSKANRSTIDGESVLKILKAQSLTWENGNTVVLLIDDLELINPKSFDEVLGMSKTQFIEYWRIKFFSGRALIPKQIKSASNALSILSENKNGIYVVIGNSMPKELSENPDLRITTLKF